MKRAIAYLGLAAPSASAAAAQLVSTGASLKLNDVYYFVSPFSQGKAHDGPLDIEGLPRAFGVTPVTVVSEPVARGDLAGLFANWSSLDDVWQPAFLGTIFLAGFDTTDSPPGLTRGSYDGANKTQSVVVPLAKGSGSSGSSSGGGGGGGGWPPSGPYFLDTSTGDLHQSLRLYDDFAGAFSESLLQTPQGTFQTLSAQVPSSASLTIGVPSRLYFLPRRDRDPSAKPLAGVRVGVKDIFSLAGARTSNGNRAWYNLYPPAASTAPSVQNLVDAGAVVVGLQKPSQFANGESPTADWVDYHAPFNPRGDGYNDPSSSSSGAGASVASYDWLDAALGSDTGGSVRGPAGAQGLFGNRPSHGLVGLDGVMPLSPTLDTPGFLARDPGVWDAANKALYGENYTSYGVGAGGGGTRQQQQQQQEEEEEVEVVRVRYPKTLYTLGFPAADSEAPAARMLNRFAADLAAFLDTNATELDLDEAWAASGPAGVRNGTTITELLNLTYATLITKEQTALVRDPFYADYAVAHDGRLPFVNPVPLARWAWGDAQPAGALEEAKANKTLFMNWFNTEILPPSIIPSNTSSDTSSSFSSSSATCSSGFLLYAGSAGVPTPRNRYPSAAPGAPPLGFSNGRLSVFSGAPDHVFPVGEVGSLSAVTNRTEMLPVAVDVMAARGCDGLIVRLARDLVKARVLRVPLVGSGLGGGEVLVRRDVEEWV